MKIAGIGTDIVEVERIRTSLARQPALAKRILTAEEMSGFEASNDPARYLAKRFAAKEAAVKALGTGIGHGVSWQHITIAHSDWGQPFIILAAGGLERAQALGAETLHLSYSDEKNYVVAFVVAQ